MPTNWYVATAAEAIAAAQFARMGFDVSVQYGANQPEYDLIVSQGERMLKISVKGSSDGGWGLTQGLLKNADYHAAVDAWAARHKPLTILCFVQFKDVDIDAMPRIYLATPAEVAQRLKAASGGRGHTSLRENHAWGSRAAAAGTVDRIPDAWRLSEQRLARMFEGKSN